MLKEELKAISSAPKDLRNFGLVVGAVFAAIGAYSLIWGRGLWWPVVLGMALMLCGAMIPQALRSLQRVWMTLAVVLGFMMSRVILSLLFLLVITPLGLLLKIAGKKPLKLDYERTAHSYWITREENDIVKDRYEKQY